MIRWLPTLPGYPKYQEMLFVTRMRSHILVQPGLWIPLGQSYGSMPCIGDFYYWLLINSPSDCGKVTGREEVVVSRVLAWMLLNFSFSCGIFNIKLGNVWNLLGSGLFWLNFGMCWQGLGSLVLRVVIYGNSRYKLFSISCWKNSSMNLAIQLQMCACHLDLASIWFYFGWGIPKKTQNHGY